MGEETWEEQKKRLGQEGRRWRWKPFFVGVGAGFLFILFGLGLGYLLGIGYLLARATFC